LLISTIIEIKQDGTGDFIVIQLGIDASVNGDTVLVYPGIYYENLFIVNMNIVLASLYLVTEDETYISNTILDGNHLDSVIKIQDIENGESQIIGFTIENGSGYYYNSFGTRGGGIYSDNSNTLIKKCLIKKNFSVYGGGLCLMNSFATLIGNTFKHNHSFKTGGGISISQNSNISYDNETKNSIYLNYAAVGSMFLNQLVALPRR